jgi:hypothetical protein
MPAIELLTGFVTAPGATLTALTMASGNSLTIRNTALEANILLLNAWTKNQAAGVLRIRSPRMHDNVQGIRLGARATEPRPLLPFAAPQKLITQDTLVVELSGSATAGDIETACMLVYYPELPGIEAKLITPDELQTRMVDIMATENTILAGTTGGYTGEEALSAEFNQFKANTEYAILGYLCSVLCAAVRYRGSDFGNLGLGGPGHDYSRTFTANWFVDLSYQTGLPCIPVFNSANISNVLIDVAQDENGTDPTIQTICAELK